METYLAKDVIRMMNLWRGRGTICLNPTITDSFTVHTNSTAARMSCEGPEGKLHVE